ncbi:MAG: lipopolysaccharide biosynthesis protein [Chitinispirillaceae bacterium]
MNQNTATTSLSSKKPANSYGSLAARSSMALTVAKVLRFGLTFMIQAILINLLNPGEFGLMKYVTFILGIVNLITTAGLTTAIIQKKELSKEELGPVFLLNLFICCGLYLIIYAISPLLSVLFKAPELTTLIRIGSLVVPLGGVSVVHRAVMQREFRYSQYSLIEICSAVLSSAAAVIMAFMGYGVWALVGSLISFHLCSTLLAFLLQRNVGCTFSGISRVLPLFWFSSGWILQKVIEYFNANLDNLMVGRFFGTSVLGTYSIAFEIISIPQIAFGLVLGPVAISVFSRMQDDQKRLADAYLKILLYSSLGATLYALIIGLCADDLMKIITFFRAGDTWNETVTFLQFLAPLGLIYSFASYPGLLWAAKRKISLQIIWATTMTLLTMVFVGVGALYGPTGVCIALLIRAVTIFPILLMIMKKASGISPLNYLRALTPSLFCGAVSAGACILTIHLLKTYHPVHFILRLSVCVFVSISAFAGCLIFFFRPRFLQLINYLRPQAEGETRQADSM